MSSRKKSTKKVSRGRRSSSPHDVPDSQRRTQTSMMETPKRRVSGRQTNKGETSEYQKSAPETSGIRRRVVSAQKVPRRISMHGRTPSRIGRATPYRTPRLLALPWRAPSVPISVKKREKKLWKEHLKVLLKKTMKICNLSSLANFKYKDGRLRAKYEKTLKNKVLEVYPSPQIEVELNTSSCLSWRSSVVDAVWVNVKTLVPGDTADEDKMVVVYRAWLIRVDSIQSYGLENVDWFPVMLYIGREVIHQVVVDWLQGSFGCYIARSSMRQGDFLWMAGVWSGFKCFDSSHNKEDCEVEFGYTIIPPPGMSSFSAPNDRGKPRIVIKLLQKEVHEVWNSMMGNDKNEVSLEDVQGFLSAINNTAATISGLPLSLLRLQVLRTPCVFLGSSGKIRMVCQGSVTGVIRCFLSVFLQTVNSSNVENYLEDTEMDKNSIDELNNNYE